MSPRDKYFDVDLKDEVVRGSIVTYNGKILPPAPRPAPPVSPSPKQKAVDTDQAASIVAMTPWEKASREVATVTAGMSTALILGKATGPLFMSNVFTFALAGLVGYRVVWGVAPALHSPLMSVTNAISGTALPRKRCSVWATLTFSSRHGWRWWFLRYGWWHFASYNSPSPWSVVSSSCLCQRIRWLRDYKTHARYVQTYASI